MNNMRLILCANSTSKIIAPIRSRCLLVRVSAPSDDEVSRVSWHRPVLNCEDDPSPPTRRQERAVPPPPLRFSIHYICFARQFAKSFACLRSDEDATAGPEWGCGGRKAGLGDILRQSRRPGAAGAIRYEASGDTRQAIRAAEPLHTSYSGPEGETTCVNIHRLTSTQTVADRLIEKVDDDLKPQIIHWAAHYVSPHILVVLYHPEHPRSFACGWAQRRYSILRRSWRRS